MARANNTPQAQLEKLPPEKVKMIVGDLLQLHSLGRCENDEEVETRISQYFELCRNTSIRPGIESLSSALHIDRVTLWKWSQGQGCSARRAEAVRSAKSMIYSFLEQAGMQGQINPIPFCFLSKNWMGYKDSYMFEEQAAKLNSPKMTPAEIQAQIEADIPIDPEPEALTADIVDGGNN